MTLVLRLINTLMAFDNLYAGGSHLPKRMYEIRVEGLLGEAFKRWFEGIDLSHLESNQTALTGLFDQAMLRGILITISDLGLTLVSVQPLEQKHKENKSC